VDLGAHGEEDASHGDRAICAICAIANDSGRLETANVVNSGAVPVAAGPLPLAVQGVVRAAHDFGG